MDHKANIVAIRRAYMVGGRERALVELRRRFPALNDWAAPRVLARVLKMPATMPPAFRPDGMRDKPKLIPVLMANKSARA